MKDENAVYIELSSTKKSLYVESTSLSVQNVLLLSVTQKLLLFQLSVSVDDKNETGSRCNKVNGNNLIFHWSSASICLSSTGEIYCLPSEDKWTLTSGHTRTYSSLSRGNKYFIRAAHRGQRAGKLSKELHSGHCQLV